MIFGVIGPPGSGKTVLLTHLGKIAKEAGRRVLSNFATTFSEPWDVTRKPPGSDFMLLFDEAGVVLDGRQSQSQFNKAFTRWLVQLRKMDSDLAWSAQEFGQSDSRLRALTDKWFECLGFNGQVALVRIWNKHLTASRTFAWDPRETFTLYDTREVIEVPEIESRKERGGKLFKLE